MSVLFMSPTRNLRVTFPIDKYGKTEDVNGEKVPWPTQKFVDCNLLVDDEEIVQLMRRHSGNEANNGSMFFESKGNAKDVVEQMNQFALGIQIGEIPKLGEEDKLQLRRLSKWNNKQLLESEKNLAIEIIAHFVERLQINGLLIPRMEDKLSVIRARTYSLIDLLESEGVINGEGKTDIGGSESPNG